jgi:protocatechuate 3,4-dioxygenase beta subunit
MNRFYQMGWLLFLCSLFSNCNGQSSQDSAAQSSNKNKISKPKEEIVEKSELTYYGIRKQVSNTDTSMGWIQEGQKILLTGIVYQPDGKTPAPNVLIYYYHTNTKGKYLHIPSEKRSMPPNELGQTHGYIRGWVKTGVDGKYFIYTVRPGIYPTHDEPAHVHITIKEPNDKKEYYIDDFVFDDDKLLISSKRQRLQNRSGSGILRMVEVGALQIGERNLILGLHIPGYPDKNLSDVKSGKNVGEDVFSFIPFHAWGPDRGTKTCPVCKYGWYHGILYFVGNHPNWDEINQWLIFLERESKQREKYLKVYFVYGNENAYSSSYREATLEKMGKELKLEKIALTFVPSFSDRISEINLNEINPTVNNTFILYKRSRIIGKFINLKPNEENFKMIKQEMDNSINEYFNLPKPHRD